MILLLVYIVKQTEGKSRPLQFPYSTFSACELLVAAVVTLMLHLLSKNLETRDQLFLRKKS
jgi:hypothetical protein